MLGQDIITFFEAIGTIGLVLAFAIISFLDGLAIPTLPEAWLILIAIADRGVPMPIWAATLILVGVSAAIGAQFLLYSIVKKVGLPKRLKGWMTKYTKFLVVSNEKLAFMNWIAPVVPFTGAFIAVCKWNPKVAFAYSIAGGIVKMSIIVCVAILFQWAISPDIIGDATLVLIFAVLVLSLTISFLRRRKMVRKMALLDKKEFPLELKDEKIL